MVYIYGVGSQRVGKKQTEAVNAISERFLALIQKVADENLREELNDEFVRMSEIAVGKVKFRRNYAQERAEMIAYEQAAGQSG